MPIASPPTTYQLDRPGCSGIACGPYLSIRDPLNLERELPVGQTGAVSVRGLPTFTGYETDAARGVPPPRALVRDAEAMLSAGWVRDPAELRRYKERLWRDNEAVVRRLLGDM